MGGSSKKVTVGYRYYLGIHMVLCHGPIDYITHVKVDNRLAWIGLAGNEQITIDKPGLFGGDEREGGVSGAVDIMMGASDQTKNSYLQGRLGTNIPAFRGVVSAVLRQCYLGLNPYLKRWSFRGQRIFTTTDGADQWYREKAAIASNSLVVHDSAFQYQTASNTVPPDPSSWPAPTSGWSNGQAPFGTWPGSAEFPPSYPINTIWAPDTGLWLQKTIVVDVQNSLRIYGFVENAAFFYLDGELLGSYNPDNDQVEPPDTLYNFDLLIDSSYLTVGTHTLHVYLLDESAVSPGNDITYFYMFFGSQIDMNPAHIIRECLTDTLWGMGYPEADIDDTSFMAAADTLFDEKMGISLLWDRQIPIEDYIKEIVRHINATLFVDRITGQFTLKLIRNDYVIASLLTLDESNISNVSDYSRVDQGDAVNSVSVIYWDADTGENASVTADDVALIQAFGGVINTTIQYPGFTNSIIAAISAQRDLKTLSTPLLSATIEANREASTLNIGDVFKFEYPDYHDGYILMRVHQIALGDGKKNRVKITASEDIFATPSSAIVAKEPPAWEEPGGQPVAPPDELLFEAPYYEIVQLLGQTSIDNLLATTPEIGYLQAAASRPTNGLNATLWVNDGGGYDDTGVLDFSPVALLAEDIDRNTVSFTYSDDTDIDVVEIGTHFQIGSELMRIDSINTGTSTLTVGRGVLDTVPENHAIGDSIIFWDAYTTSDNTEYVDGETLYGKILTNSSEGQLAIADGNELSVIMDSRAVRPYPPAKLQTNSSYFPISIYDELVLSWVHRDRIQQTADTIYDFLDDSIGPEAGTTYTLRIYGEDGTTLGRTETGLTTSYTYDDLDEFSDFNYNSTNVGSPGDEDFASVELLLHCNGSDTSTTFTDDSDNSYSVTASGNAQIDTAQSVFGGASGLFDGTGDYLSIPTALISASGDFSVEFRFRLAALGTRCEFYSQNGVSSPENGRLLIFYLPDDDSIRFFVEGTPNDVYITTGASSVAANTWYSLQVSRSGNTFRIFLDGDLKDSATETISVYQSSTTQLARNHLSGFPFYLNGWLDEFRVSSIARNTSSYTIDSIAFYDQLPVYSNRLASSLRYELEAVRDGYTSYFKHDVTIYRSGYGYNYGYYYGRTN